MHEEPCKVLSTNIMGIRSLKGERNLGGKFQVSPNNNRSPRTFTKKFKVAGSPSPTIFGSVYKTAGKNPTESQKNQEMLRLICCCNRFYIYTSTSRSGRPSKYQQLKGTKVKVCRIEGM